jgi:hypothetical protein
MNFFYELESFSRRHFCPCGLALRLNQYTNHDETLSQALVTAIQIKRGDMGFVTGLFPQECSLHGGAYLPMLTRHLPLKDLLMYHSPQ